MNEASRARRSTLHPPDSRCARAMLVFGHRTVVFGSSSERVKPPLGRLGPGQARGCGPNEEGHGSKEEVVNAWCSGYRQIP
jgi:hypothetical protein